MSGYRYGDVVWADFDPSVGHEQRKRRPAVVVSNDGYNRYNNLITVIPITSSAHYPLHVSVGAIPNEDDGSYVQGWAEVEQVKSLDLDARDAVRVASVGDEVLERITTTLLGCLMTPVMTIEWLD